MRSFATAVAIIWAAESDARANKGSCKVDKLEGISSFSESRFEGRWYTIAQDQQFYDVSSHC